ncbi:hypothetical protein JCM3770_003259, partial [Rhodotorula araucariae]
MSPKGEEDPKAAALAAAVATLPSHPTPLPADSHLRGSENYDVWCIQICGLVGPDANRVITGELTRLRPNPLTSTEWARLNNFAISSLVISCMASVIHHVPDVPVDTHGYWRALRAAFRPTDAQGSLRLLTRFWGLSLPAGRLTHAIAVANQSTLPKPDTILDIVRNEVLRTAPAGGSIALAAGNADPPTPLPCPACKANHWLQ